jgi:glyoxylase-like metal-dependent hydrolase (beta-lactamase superfamily II)
MPWLGETEQALHVSETRRRTPLLPLWPIREESILVDTGFSPEAAERRDLDNYTHPLERLAQLRVNPISIHTIIISHLQWDHFATPEFFPQATFYLQEREARFFAGPFARYRAFSEFVDPESVGKMISLNYQGRFRFIEGVQEILPGLRLHLTGGHTPGHQIVEVNTTKGKAILGIDACHLYRNLEEMVPGGVIVDLREMVQGLEMVKALASAPSSPSGHDPLLLKKVPQGGEGIMRLV